MRFDKRLPGDEWYDEVEIVTVPRFKTSDLSGDEWRTSAVLRLKRKGQTLFERSFGRLETACAFLPGLFIESLEGGFQLEMERPSTCMQPGCAKDATVHYRMKHQYYDGQILDDHGTEFRRHFCDEHAHRGDSSYEDCDANYELIAGKPADKANIPNDVISEARLIVIDPSEMDDSE